MTANLHSYLNSKMVGLTLLLASGFGCNTAGQSPVGAADSQSAQRHGNLHGHFEAGGSLETSCGTVAGVNMHVAGPDGYTEWCSAPFLNFDSESTEFDQVADCYLVVKPGIWSVEELNAVDENDNILECCTAVLPDPVLVGALETSEVFGMLSCDSDQNGGLDIVVVINVAPVIVDLSYTPSKFGSTCAPILLSATAEDADGGIITYGWEVIDAPAAASYALQSDANTAAFTSATLGDYTLRVTATDDQGASTQLDFPIHIVGLEATDCDLEEECENALP